MQSCNRCAFISQMTLSSSPVSESACSLVHTKGYVFTLVFLFLYKAFLSSLDEGSSVYQLSFHAEPLMSHKSPIFHFLDTPSSLALSCWVFQGPVHPSLRQTFCVQGSFALPIPIIPFLLYKSPDYYTTEIKLPYFERKLKIYSGNA